MLEKTFWERIIDGNIRLLIRGKDSKFPAVAVAPNVVVGSEYL